MVKSTRETDANDRRRYRMRKRQEDVEETRARIVNAAVELHGSVGPSHTTFSAVAEKAGVQRSTVYRHFPDEAALFGACTSHWLASHPWPRPDTWREESDPAERLRRGLRELYGYYDDNEQMISNSFRDFAVMPPFVGEFMRAQLQAMHAALSEPWRGQGDDRLLAAAIGHALDFRSWQSLTGSGLSARDAAGLMSTMVLCVTGR